MYSYSRLLKKLANHREDSSKAAQMRKERFKFFLQLLGRVEKPINILDVGGTERFWQKMQFPNSSDIHITILNQKHQEITSENFTFSEGDARNMGEFDEDSFDVVFSNSVIEHVGSYQDQKRMADEIIRVSNRYFVQTPNRYFPIEPHFLIPFFQFFPITVRGRLLNNFDLGWRKRVPELDEAIETVYSIQLLSKRGFLNLFPGAQLYEEKLFGLTKSFVVYFGW